MEPIGESVMASQAEKAAAAAKAAKEAEEKAKENSIALDDDASDEEVQAFLRRRQEKKDRLLAEKGKTAREEVIKLLHDKYGLTLAQIWMLNEEGETSISYYLNPSPKNGEDKVYRYQGRGKVPAWLWIKPPQKTGKEERKAEIDATSSDDKKPNPAYLCDKDGILLAASK